MTRIIFFGSSIHSIPVLEALIESPDYIVVATVTQPDKPTGRKQILTATPVKSFASKHNIKVTTPLNLEDAKFTKSVKNLKVDLLITADYGLLLPKTILEFSKYGGLNLHPSLLPKYRGSSPAQWAIRRGEKLSGMTIIKMVEKFDQGGIVAQEVLPITSTETPDSFYAKAFKAGASLLMQILPDYLKGNLKLKKQKVGSFEYARRLRKEDGRLDWKKPPEEIERMIRAFSPWPGTWTTLGELIKRYRGTKGQRDIKDPKVRRVKILKAHLDENKRLVLDKVQVEGKRPVSWEEFKRGYLRGY